MKIQKIKLEKLKPLEVNVRKHGENQIKELIRSINQFGQTRAIVIDEDNNILIGNGLYEAMVKAGFEEAFIYRKSGLSEIEKKKLILADNKTYSLGADDYENIEAYLEEITATGDFDIAGFDDDVLRSLMREADEVLADVQNYGVLDKGIIEQKQQVAASRTNNDDTQKEQQNNDIEKQTAVPAVVDDTPAQEVATILCPNCGECIPID
jgi:ParB-like chromosome segregation protein Spo0J